MKKTPWGEVIMGALLLAMVAMPSIATTIGDWVSPIFDAIPASWLVFGTYSIAIFAAAIGGLVGYLIYKT